MLTDIVYDNNNNSNHIIEFNRGDIGTLVDIVTESNTNGGVLLYEVPAVQGGAVEYAFAF